MKKLVCLRRKISYYKSLLSFFSSTVFPIFLVDFIFSFFPLEEKLPRLSNYRHIETEPHSTHIIVPEDQHTFSWIL